MTTTRLSVRSIIEPSEPNASRPVGEDLAEELVGAVLHERHLAGGDPVERGLVRVVDADAQAGIGEGEAQGQADVAAAAEDDDVEVRRGFGHGWTLPARCGVAPNPEGPERVWYCSAGASGRRPGTASRRRPCTRSASRRPSAGRPSRSSLARDHDRSSTPQPSSCAGPALAAGDDVLVGVPRGGREELDARVDRDRQVGQGELEPGAPWLRVEQPVARPGRRAQRRGDPGRCVADDAGGRVETRFDRSPDRQQGDAGERRSPRPRRG